MSIEEVYFIILEYFYLIIYPALEIVWGIIETWWWLPLPFILFDLFKYHYLYFIQERWDSKIKKILIEIKIPKEVNKPIKAMEQIFAGLHGVFHASPNWRETWIDGEFQLSFTLELVSVDGKIHFYMRIPEMFRDAVESVIYSQYPSAEISLADDYTKRVPQDVPNKNWDIWGADFISARNQAYPIKTYKEFEVENERLEEKKLDPLSVLLEGMSLLRPGEQMWFQIRPHAVLGKDHPWQDEGKKLVNKLAKRPEASKSKSIFKGVIDIIISMFSIWSSPSKESQKEIFPPEMKLTPGEKDVITAVEKKLSKLGFDSFVRFVYIGKKDVFLKTRVKTIFSFFKELSTENLGGFKPVSKTGVKIKSTFSWFLDKKRMYQRKRKMFRHYVNRVSPLFPISGMTFILNIEELATLFHFPSEGAISTIAVSRVEAKKREAPSDLPIL